MILQTFINPGRFATNKMGKGKRSLEDFLIENVADQNFKSRGERKIADFLNANNIEYQYEREVLVSTVDDKIRIYYPDFFLREFGTYIEYYGMVGDPDYDRGIKAKKIAYSKTDELVKSFT